MREERKEPLRSGRMSLPLWCIMALVMILSGCRLFGGTPAPDTTKTFFTNSVGMTFVLIPDGSFMMGSPSGEPGRYRNEMRHRVTIDAPFYIQATEVTQGQWKAVMGENPSFFADCGDTCPVENVSWEDVGRFIKRLNEMEETERYRLPTEAEWEYACRAGTEEAFSTGGCISSDQANFNGVYEFFNCPAGEFRGTTTDAATFLPNAWGLYDMHGNVWEWCMDWMGAYSGDRDDNINPEGPSKGTERVLRGGAWNSLPWQVRSAARMGSSPKGFTPHTGFRLISLY